MGQQAIYNSAHNKWNAAFYEIFHNFYSRNVATPDACDHQQSFDDTMYVNSQRSFLVRSGDRKHYSIPRVHVILASVVDALIEENWVMEKFYVAPAMRNRMGSCLFESLHAASFPYSDR
jgi:hypothetical protein